MNSYHYVDVLVKWHFLVEPVNYFETHWKLLKILLSSENHKTLHLNQKRKLIQSYSMDTIAMIGL